MEGEKEEEDVIEDQKKKEDVMEEEKKEEEDVGKGYVSKKRKR